MTKQPVPSPMFATKADQLVAEIRSRCLYWLGRVEEAGEARAQIEALRKVTEDDFASDLEYLLALTDAEDA